MELITSRRAISEGINIINWVKSAVEIGNVENIMDGRLEGCFDINTAWKVVEIAIACVSPTSIKRPTMNDVVMDLKHCLQSQKSHQSGSMSFNLESFLTLLRVSELSVFINMMNTRKQEVDKAIPDHAKAIFDLQITLPRRLSIAANSVPAINVIQRMQALSRMIGRKASVGGFLSPPSNPRARLWTGGGNYQAEVLVGAEGISGGAVKCV
ncbi:hypothetical protein QVD17_20351 [Tagetes erecta]|nr:hypothetical protein QVD17_20350 [Tagetes erecta]KAK1425009.1 hypothetical protein QVD17_20351 [Tagetes erecta]